MVDVGRKFAKYSMIFVNFLLVLIGIAMIVFGSIALYFQTFFDGTEKVFPILLIVAGSVIFIVAFLGCCGAKQESTCMLFIFSAILIAIVKFEIGIAAGVFAKKDKLDGIVNDALKKTLVAPDTQKHKAYYEAWHLLQQEFNCCGITGPTDWADPLGGELPGACCNQPIDFKKCTINESYQKGCKKEFYDFVKENMLIIASIGLGAAVLQLFGIVFSCCLYSTNRRNRHL